MSLLDESSDNLILDFARELIACKGTDDIIHLYAARFGVRSFETENVRKGGAYPAAFGRSQGVMNDLLFIIARQAGELAKLRAAAAVHSDQPDSEA